MDFFSILFGFFWFIGFGGTSRSGRRYGGLFGGLGRSSALFGSGSSSGWKGTRGRDFWAEKYHQATSGRHRSDNPFRDHSGPSIPRQRSHSRNMPQDPWEKRWNEITRSRSRGYSKGRSSFMTGRRPGSGHLLGSHGEFDTNDRMLADMEDMQQFHHSDSSFNPSEHGYDWDEIMDAKNEGFLD